eukprot:Nk52_evm52s1401 gene=Nk52_evmTU52s1401
MKKLDVLTHTRLKGRSDVFDREILELDQKLEVIETAYKAIKKRGEDVIYSGTGNSVEKRQKKTPLLHLATTLQDHGGIIASSVPNLGGAMMECGRVEKKIAELSIDRDVDVETTFYRPVVAKLEGEIKHLNSQTKKLNKTLSEMDSCKKKMMAAGHKNESVVDSFHQAKRDFELESEATSQMLTAFFAKEEDHIGELVQLLRAQLTFHSKAASLLEDILPHVEAFSEVSKGTVVFGRDLQEYVESRGDGSAVPFVVVDCISSLVSHNAAPVEGIFRLSASTSSIKKVKRHFDAVEAKAGKGEGTDVAKLVDGDVHAVAGCLKLYLRELPTSLIPPHLYQRFVNAVKDESHALENLKAALGGLPYCNYATLSYIISYLRYVASFSDENKMHVNNIAIVFGPTLLRSENEDDLSAAMADSGSQCAVVVKLVEHFDEVFEANKVLYTSISSSRSTRRAAPPPPMSSGPRAAVPSPRRPTSNASDSPINVRASSHGHGDASQEHSPRPRRPPPVATSSGENPSRHRYRSEERSLQPPPRGAHTRSLSDTPKPAVPIRPARPDIPTHLEEEISAPPRPAPLRPPLRSGGSSPTVLNSRPQSGGGEGAQTKPKVKPRTLPRPGSSRSMQKTVPHERQAGMSSSEELERSASRSGSGVWAVVLYEYQATDNTQLSLTMGSEVWITDVDEGAEWWFGECNGESGWIPSNYVERM